MVELLAWLQILCTVWAIPLVFLFPLCNKVVILAKDIIKKS